MPVTIYCSPCSQEHYHYEKCEPVVWMVDEEMIHKLEEIFEKGRIEDIRIECGDPIFKKDELVGYEPDRPNFTYNARTKWLEEMFPDIDGQVRHNPWMGLLCEKHIGSMRPYANKIIGYK